jgi:prolyl oligopeptidase
MRTSLLALALLAGCSSSSSAPPPPPKAAPDAAAAKPAAYPAARKGDVVEEHFGVKVADPYRWMEDMDSADTKAWVAAENQLADAFFAGVPGKDKLRARIAEMLQTERWGLPIHRGDRYFWTYSDGKSNQPFLMTAPSLDAQATTLLDPNTISTDGSLAYAGHTISDDGKLLAYGISQGGGDWTTWHLRDVATGKDLPDELPFIKYYPPQLSHDGTRIYYSRFPAPPAGKELTETDHDNKVYVHVIGQKPDSDTVVYQRPDHATEQFQLAATRDGHYLVIAIGDGQVGDRSLEQIASLDLTRPGAKPVMLIDHYDADYVFVGSHGSKLLFQTNKDAANKRIVAIDVDDPKHALVPVVPEGKLAIDSATVIGEQILVTSMKDASSSVTAYDLTGKPLHDVALPGPGSVFELDGESAEAFYYFTSALEPGAIERVDLATGKSTPWKQPKVAFDRSQLETKQIFFPSKDGTKVPMFVTMKKGLALDGSHPTVITAYGFGGVPMLPYFDPADIAWIERGGISVLVNIRGGGEYGESWHLAAARRNRQTGFDDFIAAGEWLIANHYTSHEHLGAVGTSGGGMLVGAVTNERPDLWGATAPIAGVHDLLRFQLFGQGAGWQGDMGSPDDADDFKFLYSISPLHNVKPGTSYPAMFLVTSDQDVRVAPLHTYKYAAALQAAQAGPGRIIVRVETESGHGGGSTLTQYIDQSAEQLAFFASTLGLDLTK